MNGIHDLGGMDGFTLPEREREETVFAEEWERLVWGVAMGLEVPGLYFGGRAAIERIPPALYLAMPYYARWLQVREQVLLERGLVTAAELMNPDGPISPHGIAGFRPASPAEVLGALTRDSSSELPLNVPPRFAVGDAVAARNEHPLGHTRAPRYVRGRRGTIHRDHGVHAFQDDRPAGVARRPQHLYSVVFTATELWGARGHRRDRVYVDLWDDHLELAS